MADVPLSTGQSSWSHPPAPAPARQQLPVGPVGTGPRSRGDNPAFVLFVQRPEQGWALLLHKGISWCGLVPLSPLSAQGWGLRQEVDPAGVWSIPSLCQRIRGWQRAGGLCWHQGRGWSSEDEEQHVLWHGHDPVPTHTGGKTQGWQLLLGTLPRFCFSQWGEASVEGWGAIDADCYLGGTEVPARGELPKSG